MSWHKFFPFLSWWPELQQGRNLRSDALAGITGAVVVLPQGVAFASLAGMPVQYGLYTAMVPCLMAALFGSSRQMVTGPANAISLTTLALVAPLAVAGSARYVELVLTLTFMVALMQLTLAFSGLAKWVDQVPHSVIVGFTTGAAVLILNSQLGSFFGLDLPKGRSIFTNLPDLIRRFDQILLPTTLVATVTLLACMVGRRVRARVPYMLTAILAGSLCYALGHFLLPDSFTVKTVGALPRALPELSSPSWSLETWRALLLPAAIMTLLALTEAMSIARAYALRAKQELNSRQEMIGQGLANFAGAFFSSYPASGSFNRSGLNVESGAVTPFSAVCAGLFLVVLLFFVAPLARYLPIPSISAILVMVAWTLFEFDYPAKAWKEDRLDFIAWLVTFILTVTVSLELAILVGLLVYFLGRKISPK